MIKKHNKATSENGIKRREGGREGGSSQQPVLALNELADDGVVEEVDVCPLDALPHVPAISTNNDRQ